jgi:hypothetical protein
VVTRCYETNPGWILLTCFLLKQFQNRICCISGSIIVISSIDYALDGNLIVN